MIYITESLFTIFKKKENKRFTYFFNIWGHMNKAQIFLRGHRNLKKKIAPAQTLLTLSKLQNRWEIFSNFVAFSQSHNIKEWNRSTYSISDWIIKFRSLWIAPTPSASSDDYRCSMLSSQNQAAAAARRLLRLAGSNVKSRVCNWTKARKVSFYFLKSSFTERHKKLRKTPTCFDATE